VAGATAVRDHDAVTGSARGRFGRLEAVLTYGAFVVFVITWAAFAYALVVDPSAPEAAWAHVQDLPLALQVVAWIVLLPLMVGLWAWVSDLGPLVTALVAAGLVAWTLASVRSTIRLLRAR
jgi:hypothetical protein